MRARAQVHFVAAEADRWFQSWTYWDINDNVYLKDQGGWDMDAVGAFVRTYATAVAGDPVETSFDPRTAAFSLRFEADAAIAAPTEVVAPALLYPGGFAVEVGGSAGLSWEAAGSDRPGVLLFTATSSGDAAISIVRN